jgi:hypothetical protein
MTTQAVHQSQPTRREQAVENLVRQLGRWRLTVPSILLLEATKPFSFFASQGLLLCQPLLGFLGVEEQLGNYADLLADRTNVDYLIARLEEETESHDPGIKRGN